MAKMHYEFVARFGIETIDSSGKKVSTNLRNKLERYEVLGNCVDDINAIWKNLKIEPQILFSIDLDKFAELETNYGTAFFHINSKLGLDKICDLLDEIIKHLNPYIIRTYQYNSYKFTDYLKIGVEPICIYRESLEQWQKEQEESMNSNEDYPNYCWN